MKVDRPSHPVFGLTDDQMKMVISAAVHITDPDKRGTFLVRLGAHLREHGTNLSQLAFERLLEHCLKGLVQKPAA
jgi:hypothetical protein